MTTKSLSCPRGISAEQLLEFGRTRTLILGLLALLSAAVLSATAFRPAGIALATPAAVEEAAPTLAVVRPDEAAPVASKKIEALAAFLAKKYRVSLDVTQQLVSTAYTQGARAGVDPLLIIAVMAVESSFNPIAESVAGAKGLMQIIPRYHADKFDATEGESAMLDPETNIQVGARVLKEYIHRGGGLISGLQLYNGSATDNNNAYANKVLGEQQRLQQVIRRVRKDA